ncbi:MAG: hypothetical protein NC089_01955 [Bacteroides sp.]|nr:hypothetical protein [Bacteroides sp.]MCM1548888.1 hypothetical protein [Clostridium sp.]
MVLEDEKKKMILKRLRQSAMKKLLAILVISSCSGIFVVLIMSFSDDLSPYAKMMAFGIFALLMLLFQLDDFSIAACMLVECLILKKPEVKYDIVNASQIKPSPWPLHLGSRLLNRKMAVYEYEGKSRTSMLWANVMVRSKDFRLLLLVVEKKHKSIYAFPLVNFIDVMNR